MKSEIFTTNPVFFNDGIRREIPRPVEKRQPGYEDLYDDSTLFYDIFRYGSRIVLSGPPLFNLIDEIKSAKFIIGEYIFDAYISDKWKTQRSYIDCQLHDDEIKIESKISSGTYSISCDNSSIFDGKKVLFTLSKNNKLDWIYDWAEFHVKTHGVNAVLLYDNNSDNYTLEDIQEALNSVNGLESIGIVHWPYKYGPGAGDIGNWDSDFCQYSLIEHARRRFLSRAIGVINADIDELVVCNDGTSIFTKLLLSPKGAISYNGIWLEPVGDFPDPRHKNFRYFRTARDPATKKWTAKPSAIPDDVQMHVHGFGSSFEPLYFDDVKHRHFSAINYDWKTKRSKPIAYKASIHEVDTYYVKAMQAIGWD